MKSPNSLFSKIMVFTAVAAVLATGILAVAYRFSGQAWILPAVISAGTTAYHFVMRLLTGQIVPHIAGPMDHHGKWFQPQRFEVLLYEKLRVKKWKGKLPTYAPEQFDLKLNTLQQVIRNTCTAELVHETIVLLSFLPLVCSRFFGAFPVFLLTSLAAALFDCIFIIAQRYNRPRLIRILAKKEASGRE